MVITHSCPFSITLSLEEANLLSLPYRLREKAVSLFLATCVPQILANRFCGTLSRDSHIPSLWALRFVITWLLGQASVGRWWDIRTVPCFSFEFITCSFLLLRHNLLLSECHPLGLLHLNKSCAEKNHPEIRSFLVRFTGWFSPLSYSRIFMRM